MSKSNKTFFIHALELSSAFILFILYNNAAILLAKCCSLDFTSLAIFYFKGNLCLASEKSFAAFQPLYVWLIILKLLPALFILFRFIKNKPITVLRTAVLYYTCFSLFSIISFLLIQNNLNWGFTYYFLSDVHSFMISKVLLNNYVAVPLVLIAINIIVLAKVGTTFRDFFNSILKAALSFIIAVSLILLLQFVFSFIVI
jgi:hypothetical protein